MMREAARWARSGPARCRRSARSSSAPTGSRCTPSRRSGCCSTTASSRRVDGVYRPVGDLIRLDVPETLHALIAARLDGLDAADRSLLQDAAVLGQTFTRRCAGRRVRAGTRGGRAATCAPSSAASSSPRTIDPRSPERGQYGRSSRRSSARSATRRCRSATDARATSPRRATSRGSATTSWPGSRRLHYLDAYLAMPDGPEGEAVAAQARLALRGAAERASALHSNDLALTYLEQALSITPDSAEDPELLERAGNAGFEAGRHDAAETHLTRAIERYRAVGDRVGLLRATAALGASYVSASQIGPAIATLRAATEEYPELEGQPAMVSVGAQLARAYMLREEPQSGTRMGRTDARRGGAARHGDRGRRGDEHEGARAPDPRPVHRGDDDRCAGSCGSPSRTASRRLSCAPTTT